MSREAVFGLLVAGLYLWAGSQTANAAVNCDYANNARPFVGTMALTVGSLTAARDAPIGTRLYIQEFHQAGPGVTFQCDVSNASMTSVYKVNGLGAKLDFNVGPYAGKVYATGVPGIGVVWWGGQVGAGAVGAEVVSTTPAPTGCSNRTSTTCESVAQRVHNLTAVMLIKTGPVGTGTIRASDLGRLVLSSKFGDSEAYATAEVGITGNINVVELTCRTPDVTVPMGSHRTSVFTGRGSASPRVNFSIVLSGCPGFPGYFGNINDGTVPAASQSAVTNVGTRIPNSISIRVDPVTPPIDAPNGILRLTAGPGSAMGVGVQLMDQWGIATRALSVNRPVFFDPPLGARNTSLRLSYSARFLQIDDIVTAGTANAVATYTIIYH
ncbi:fimbrial protein [Pseudomonas proteolytica]|uniref:fimbrial protein n=1 Tax=Pseudomonas proteolytica TaxID=219574 RepID=UPI0023DEC965|nr:fimbrial protein [Pseudomonas proteolytica]MDF3162814.1 fimbrial protein [Pseudomonas proteolytica]